MLSLLASAALCVANVHDGDTIRTCGGERIRIANIDAPELPGSPRCASSARRGRASAGWCDYDLAVRSRNSLAALLASGPVQIERIGKDRYGRTLAKLSVRGQDAGEYLIAKGVARRW
jgi:Micrococcal nuclease (thermonuclease) homologs